MKLKPKHKVHIFIIVTHFRFTDKIVLTYYTDKFQLFSYFVCLVPFYTLLNQVFPMDHTQRRDEEPLHLTYTSHSKLPLYTHQLPVMKTGICKGKIN